MNDEQIKYMVDRFLSWKLPKGFHPDGGISFEQVASVGTPHEFIREPSGTNLLDFEQAKAMVKYMIDGMPPAADVSNGHQNPCPICKDKRISEARNKDGFFVCLGCGVIRPDPPPSGECPNSGKPCTCGADNNCATQEPNPFDVMTCAYQAGFMVSKEYGHGKKHMPVSDCETLLDFHRAMLAAARPNIMIKWGANQ